jgi:NAD-dependent deacetylase
MGALAEIVKRSRRIVAFTGAGVSTLSGIRDFRGKNGVYRQLWHGYQVEEILSLDCFRSQPELFYEWAKEFVYSLDDYRPGAMHTALAHLESVGKLPLGIYTQNIDLLHQRAGSRQVYEIHGSPAQHHCLRCRTALPYAEVAPTVMAGKVPRCPKCGGLIKPDIVFYGENLDEDLLQRGFAAFGGADLALVMGSSLTVYPAAALPEAAARNGVPTVIINEQPTHLDDLAVLRIESLEEAAKELAGC